MRVSSDGDRSDMGEVDASLGALPSLVVVAAGLAAATGFALLAEEPDLIMPRRCNLISV